MNFKDMNDIIQSNKGLLEQEFSLNNIKKSKQKNKYNCISCSSSDALHLYSETNTCHCYSCNNTWNVIGFIMEMQGLDYINALKYLNQTYSLNLPLKTENQIKNTESKLKKRFKEYKEILIEKEIDKFREIENNIYDKIRSVNSGKLDNDLSDVQKENLIKSYDDKLFEISLELEYKKGIIEDLTLEFADISEMLEMEIINQKQKEFIQNKLELVNKSIDVENSNKLEMINYFYNLKYDEYINYSKYSPNVIIDVNNYISENSKLDMLLNYKKSLLIAPTGSGKTFSVLNMFKSMEKLIKKQNKKICFVVPNATQVQQIQEEYKIKGAWSDANQDLIFIQNTISCYTWDKFGKIESDLSNTIVILDEIHQIYTDMYRKNKIDSIVENLNKCIGRIDITATPNKIDFNIYDFIMEYNQKIQTDYNVNVYENIDDNEIINIINNSKGKVALFKDDISYLEAVCRRTINKKFDIINSSNKDTNLTYANIIKSSTVGNIDLLCNTSVMVAGVNINEPNIKDIILVDVKDKATIKQYIARFRGLKNVNVHIFNNYQDINTIYSLENYINYTINEVQKTCDHLNIGRFEGLENAITDDNILFKSLEKDTMAHKINGIYVADTISIRNKVYTSYYNKCDIVSFISSLEEYFSQINRIKNDKSENKEIKQDKKEANKLSKEFIEKLYKHKEYLIGYYDIKKDKSKKEVIDYLKENKLTKEKVIKYVKENQLEYMLDNTKVKKQIDGFTKLVLDKGYTVNLAYKLQTMNNKTKSNLFEKLNVLLYDEIKNECNDLLDNKSIEVRLYDFILDEFPLTTSYTDEDIDQALIELYDMHKIKLTSQKFKNYLNYIYVVDSKQIKLSKKEKKVTPSNYKYNKNNISIMLPNEKIKTHERVYKLSSYHTLDSICKEYQLNDIDKECIKSIINKKIDLIKIKKEKVIDIINIFN